MGVQRPWFLPTIALLLLPMAAAAQNFDFEAPASAADPVAATALRDLALRVLPVYEDADNDRYLANLSALQLVGGNYAAANDTRKVLWDRRQAAVPPPPADDSVIVDVYARAMADEARGGEPFPQAFAEAFREVVPTLSDQDANAVTTWLATPPTRYQERLQRSFDRLRPAHSVSTQQAIDLVWDYLSFEAHSSFGLQVEALAAEDRQRRYTVSPPVMIKTVAGDRIGVVVVHPIHASGRLPALLEFARSPSLDDARSCAAHGYAGVLAYPVADASQPSGFVLFRNEGRDAESVIRWIAKQAWSDGRVGMYGGDYSGFAAWAAAARAPQALKAIAVSDPMAPGIDFPKEGGIYRNRAYWWSLSGGEPNSVLDPAQREREHALDLAWYASGKAYRSLDQIAGARSPQFIGWLDHPSYDRFWSKTMPSASELAHGLVAVLAVTGYYSDGQSGALRWFGAQSEARPQGSQTLLIGPYDNRSLRDGPTEALRGYALDTAALIDLPALRFEWFDSIFKGAVRPALLSAPVNYEVPGANVWRHAASLAAAADGAMRFYLDAGADGRRTQLVSSTPAGAGFVDQTVKLADRTDTDWTARPDVGAIRLPIRDGIAYVGEPLRQPIDLAGPMRGVLDFMPNRMDLDLNLTAYELQPGGTYVLLFNPYEFRASYVPDPVHRSLLKAGERQQLAFTSEHFASHRLQAGSRLVLVLGINKRPDREIDYGSGKNVSEETIADGKEPLQVRWFGDSYVELPIAGGGAGAAAPPAH